jgi:hypothetical protein
MTATTNALRHQLRAAGYCPIPLFFKEPPAFGKNTKAKGLKGWQNLTNVSAAQIDMWSKTWPDALNTGVLTRTMPTLDADILNAEAIRTIEQHVREHYEERGHILPRVGKPPKLAIPFRTEEPFKKIVVNLIAPDGSEGQKIEFLADGEQVVVAGIHPETKEPYRWLSGEPGAIKLLDLPYIREQEARALVDDIVELLVRDHGYKRAPGRKANGAKPAPRDGGGGGDSDWAYLHENIRKGREVHDSVRDLATKMIMCGTNPGAAINQLRALVDISDMPKDERWRLRVSEIPAAVDSAIAKYGRDARSSVEPAVAKTKPPASVYTIEDTIKVFEKWLILNDRTPIYAMLGTIAANLLPGDPVWLGLIAPPSSAKTELLKSIEGLPHVVEASSVTPAGLLSGTPKKQQDKGARGGLLRQIGSFGILLLKDFGGILSMHADSRNEALAALREVYDGGWSRTLGSAGGKTLSWKGKIGIIFAATEVIDAQHSVIGAMGDRFLLSRLKPVSGQRQFKRALAHAGTSFDEMRKQLKDAVVKLFANRRAEAAQINDDETKSIGEAVALAVRLRGAVARDYRTRELEAIYGAEGTARIGLALERLLAGLDTLGLPRERGLEVVKSVALDSVPPLRRRAYDTVRNYHNVETKDVAIALDLPTTTVRRILEDLAGHGLITRTSQGTGKADLWDAADWEAEEAREEARAEASTRAQGD